MSLRPIQPSGWFVGDPEVIHMGTWARTASEAKGQPAFGSCYAWSLGNRAWAKLPCGAGEISPIFQLSRQLIVSAPFGDELSGHLETELPKAPDSSFQFGRGLQARKLPRRLPRWRPGRPPLGLVPERAVS